MKSDTTQRRRTLALLTLMLAGGLPRAQSKEVAGYPSKPIKLLIPFAAGGASDVLGRLVGQKLSTAMGQPWVADNRPGAGGNIATEAVARSSPDGYTLLLGFDGTLVINPHIYKRPGFDPLKDFAPITKIADVPLVLVGRSSLEPKTLTELLSFAASKPGVLSFGSAGTGSTGHLVGELIKRRASIQMTHIPYRGGSAALSDVLSGTLDLMLAAVPAVSSQSGGGRLRIYGVSSKTRVGALPDVPTFSESGLAGFDVSSWYGLLAPAGTAPSVIKRLWEEVAKAVASPELVDRFRSLGAVVVGNSPAAFARDIASDLERWSEVVKAAKISAE